MSDDIKLLQQRIRQILSEAEPPYERTIGGVFLDRAWQRGAEHVAEKVIAALDQESASRAIVAESQTSARRFAYLRGLLSCVMRPRS